MKVLSFRAIIALEQALRCSRLNWNLILLLTTLGTTLWAGYQFSLPLVEKGLLDNPWTAAVFFSLGLLIILGYHEMRGSYFLLCYWEYSSFAQHLSIRV